MSNTICAANHAEWDENSLADYGDFSDMVEYVNQGEDAFSGYGEWYYIPEEVLPPMKGVQYEGKPNERVIYFGSYGNDNSPGASHYTHAEIFDMDDEDDAAEFETRKKEWEGMPEWDPEEDSEEEERDTEEEDDLPYGGSHAPDCPYRVGGECLCWRSDPDQNPELGE